MRKEIAGFLIITLLIGMIFSHMPFVAEAETVEETGLTVTMTELYNERYNLEVKKGDTVTIESAEELRMWSDYSHDTKVKNSELSGVTVELLKDIRYASGTFSYDEQTGRIGFYLYEELKGTYDVKYNIYYPDFVSEEPLENVSNELHLYNFIYEMDRGHIWCPIRQFAGTLDGNGHCIAGLWWTLSGSMGEFGTGILFGELDGEVRNLKLTQCYGDEVGRYFCGGAICNILRGTIENCHTSEIYIVSNMGWGSSYSGIGGLVGRIEDHGMIADCSAETDIVYGTKFLFPTGGLVGLIHTDEDIVIKRNYTSGMIVSLDSDSSQAIGGMIGSVTSSSSSYQGTHGTVENCVSEVVMSGMHADFCGGIVGKIREGEWLIQNCENRGEISGLYTGGIVGEANSVFVNQCRNSGHVTGRSVGGIVGRTEYAEIANTENIGDVFYEKPPRGYVDNLKEAGGMFGHIGRSGALYNSFCGGNVIAEDGVDAGIIVGKTFSKIGIDNVCAYGMISSESQDDALCGNRELEEEGEIYYPGQDLDTQCEALNTWVEKKGSVEYNYVYVEEGGTFACKKWMRGEETPILQIEDSLKPNKPEMIPLPVITPRPTATPTAVPTQRPTPRPTATPTPTVAPTLKPTPQPTVTQPPTPMPTPTQMQTPAATSTPPITQIPTTMPFSTQRPIEMIPTDIPVVSDIPIVTGIKVKAKRDVSLMIQWKQVPGVSGYSITRSSKKNSGYRELSNVASNVGKWCDRSVKEKKTYYYRVVAYRMIQGKRVYGVWHGTPKRITVKLRAPSLTVRKKKSEDGQRYLQIRIKKYRASGVELWVKKGKKPFRRIKLHGVDKKKKTNWINLSYTPSKQTLYLRTRINQKKKKKRYVSYMSKTKRIRIG